MVCLFHNEGLNPYRLQCQHSILTTGPPRKSLTSFLDYCSGLLTHLSASKLKHSIHHRIIIIEKNKFPKILLALIFLKNLQWFLFFYKISLHPFTRAIISRIRLGMLRGCERQFPGVGECDRTFYSCFHTI